MSSKKAALSAAEWRIMRLLWEKWPLSCRQIEEALKKETGWTRHDIYSFLKRMEAKQALRREGGNPHLYYPLLDCNKAVIAETTCFARRLWGGDIGRMVSALIKNQQLGEAEIDQLVQVLQAAKRTRGGGNEKDQGWRP